MRPFCVKSTLKVGFFGLKISFKKLAWSRTRELQIRRFSPRNFSEIDAAILREINVKGKVFWLENFLKFGLESVI